MIRAGREPFFLQGYLFKINSCTHRRGRPTVANEYLIELTFRMFTFRGINKPTLGLRHFSLYTGARPFTKKVVRQKSTPQRRSILQSVEIFSKDPAWYPEYMNSPRNIWKKDLRKLRTTDRRGRDKPRKTHQKRLRLRQADAHHPTLYLLRFHY